MAKKTTYFIIEVDPSLSAAERDQEFRTQGAAINLNVKTSGTTALIELGDVRPAMFFNSESGSPLDV